MKSYLTTLLTTFYAKRRHFISLVSVSVLTIIVGAALFAMTEKAGSPKNQEVQAVSSNKNIKKATFAGGCFWCLEDPYDRLKGVSATVAGYIGDDRNSATYPKVSAGKTGHREALQVTYDSSIVTYEKLLYIFWRNIDPTDERGQFCDKGFQYTTAIYPHDANQLKEATASKDTVAKKFKKQGVATQIITADPGDFFPAEDYHQDYYVKNPKRYKLYRYACGRDQQLRKLWGDYAGGH
ncbi:peptide methionine sulfoxide reductase MsrA [Spirochaetota bacterium]|nr:peptide methionine sulfoxide reductase MsrA [Spirochaetota bacterium]